MGLLPKARRITDCMGLVNTAKAGFAAATSPKMANARIWRLIGDITNGQMAPLRTALTWMPAHTSVEQCIHRRKSDLSKVTTVDWRANQLADALAKLAAGEDPTRVLASSQITDAQRALVHHAATLGMVTFAANNHPVSRELPGGCVKVFSERDSTSLPAGWTRKQRTAVGVKRKRQSSSRTAAWLSPRPLALVRCLPAPALRAAQRRARTLAASKTAKDKLAAAVQRTAAALSPPADAMAASERMRALRERIALRASR